MTEPQLQCFLAARLMHLPQPQPIPEEVTQAMQPIVARFRGQFMGRTHLLDKSKILALCESEGIPFEKKKSYRQAG